MMRLMAFANFPEQQQVVALLQRSLARGRLGHAYLFTGSQTGELEAMARTLAKTLNCEQPVRSDNGIALDCCDQCLPCRKIEEGIHADIQWVRPESKSRIVTIDQIRDLMQTVNLKPTEAEFKVGVVVGADRLNVQAANAFLKTLEEPPAKSILILLTTDPQQILETIISRCLRLNFAGAGQLLDANQAGWLQSFSELAAAGQEGLLGRYRLLGHLLARLAQLKEEIEKALTARSPLERYDDVEASLREKWEDELTAAIEAEYRRQRLEVIAALQMWLRDVWLFSTGSSDELAIFPNLGSYAQTIARRITAQEAMENLEVLNRTQRLLGSNVQEALVLEVGLLKLKL